MNKRLERIRLVVMERPCDTWGHPVTEGLFAKMLGLKIKGYGRVFPPGVLAVDTSDFVSDHLLVCEECEDGSLRPLFGNKSVSLAQCELYHLPFPGISIPEEACATEHIKAVQGLIADGRSRGVDIRYAASMTIDPRERGDKEWTRLLRELFTVLYVSYYSSLPKAEVFAGGTVRFKIDAYTRWLGHSDIEYEGRSLEPLKVPHLNYEQVMWTHLKQFSFEARQTAKKWEKLWANRIHIQVPEAAAPQHSKVA